MRAGRIRAKTVNKWWATTDSTHPYPVVLNTLNRQFACQNPTEDGPAISRTSGRPWAGSIGGEARSLLTSGHCLGYEEPPDSGVGRRGTHHDHRTPTTSVRPGTSYGSSAPVYATTRYRKFRAGHGLTASMSRRGNYWGNAVVESFFHALKRNTCISSAIELAKKAGRTFSNGSKHSIIESAGIRHLANVSPPSSK